MQSDYSLDAIVAIDACFQQKRRRGPYDPPHHHPNSVFLDREYVKSVEAHVEGLRATQKKVTPQSTPRQREEEEEGYEKSLKVPTSILNECNDSFTAADEKRQKASTQFFADTAIMALLCRHDRVLWLANMTSAGEKQFYVVALLKKFFANLPKSWTVGVLYDIACQLHRSCVKWDFLDEFLDRMVFGLSVFHAYGHQWPCQLIYHPRKCLFFGLTDGEGCERFWSAIRKLIPSLRVSGVSSFFVSHISSTKKL
jgi:Kyakuja-Dileera-Zisupton transposase